jgi:exodeoxyribonuclease V beta subunit
MLTGLEQAGHGLNLDLLGLIDWLKDRRTLRDVDGDMQPTDSTQPKVKLMTIHASKGLEFPIVFLAGGFTQRLSGGETNYRDEHKKIVFDLSPGDDARARVQAEQLSEHRRLLYVAMTRPIFKLYVPRIMKPRRGNQYLGPLGTILLPALDLASPDIKLGPMIVDVVAPRWDALAAKVDRPAGISPAPPTPLTVDGPLFTSIDPGIGKRRIVTRSFSSMARHHLTAIGEGTSFGEQAPAALDETTPADGDDPLRGPVFGDMVHRVLEEIDFTEVGRASLPEELLRPGTHARKCIDDAIRVSIALLRTRVPIEQLAEACRQQIADLVWLALTTPLSAIGGPLWQVPASDRLTEVEFLYPESTQAGAGERFITGFMDLLFRKDNKYYLLDWKTNLLPGYTRDQIERSMTDSDYRRQYQLYLQAVARWLERVHGARALDRFGGVLYLYVRGLNGRDDSSGVYFHRPTARDLDLRAVLSS